MASGKQSDSDSRPAKFYLSEGEHTIKMKLREDGTKLDKIAIRNFVVGPNIMRGRVKH